MTDLQKIEDRLDRVEDLARAAGVATDYSYQIADLQRQVESLSRLVKRGVRQDAELQTIRRAIKSLQSDLAQERRTALGS